MNPSQAPDADPATLKDPAESAREIVERIVSVRRRQAGHRQAAPPEIRPETEEVHHAAR